MARRERRAWTRQWTPRGRRHRWLAPISERTKRLMRWAVTEGGESVADVARGYGISYHHAWKIVRGWRRPCLRAAA